MSLPTTTANGLDKAYRVKYKGGPNGADTVLDYTESEYGNGSIFNWGEEIVLNVAQPFSINYAPNFVILTDAVTTLIDTSTNTPIFQPVPFGLHTVVVSSTNQVGLTAGTGQTVAGRSGMTVIVNDTIASTAAAGAAGASVSETISTSNGQWTIGDITLNTDSTPVAFKNDKFLLDVYSASGTYQKTLSLINTQATPDRTNIIVNNILNQKSVYH